MATHSHPGFDQHVIDQTLEAARSHSQALLGQSGHQNLSLDDGSLKLGAQCISVTVQNGQACLNLPLGIGNVCLPVPGWVPSGSAAQACLDICTKWGIPCGVQVTISIAGQLVAQKGFGCSC